ncbi:uncharacterized protein An12g04410, partial [Aspergillus niger]|uniref:Uncharacterized protein n=2 Tax=Aspergillus niger TaxID=5061 RepID=A0AAJ8C200_ASPNG
MTIDMCDRISYVLIKIDMSQGHPPAPVFMTTEWLQLCSYRCARVFLTVPCIEIYVEGA